MKILALETSGMVGSVALLAGDQCHSRLHDGEGQPSRQILPLLDQLLADSRCEWHEIDVLAFGRGPGSFTSLRVAAALAQGLALSLKLPLIPVSTLAALAHQGWRRYGAKQVLATLDARLGELYWAGYQLDAEGRPTALTAETVGRPTAVATLPALEWWGLGSGWQVADAALRVVLPGKLLDVDVKAVPLAEDIARLAKWQWQAAPGKDWEVAGAQPVYLRDQVAHPAARVITQGTA